MKWKYKEVNKLINVQDELNKQKTGKNLEDFSEEDVFKLPDLCDLKIISADIKTAKEVFGDKALNPEQPIIEIDAEDNEQVIFRKFFMNFSEKPSARSKMGKFLARYKSFKPGTEFAVKMDPLTNRYEIIL